MDLDGSANTEYLLNRSAEYLLDMRDRQVRDVLSAEAGAVSLG